MSDQPTDADLIAQMRAIAATPPPGPWDFSDNNDGFRLCINPDHSVEQFLRIAPVFVKAALREIDRLTTEASKDE
jgi:hypothetical protein